MTQTKQQELWLQYLSACRQEDRYLASGTPARVRDGRAPFAAFVAQAFTAWQKSIAGVN